MRYIALLRGINVGGNNKVPMSELKLCFEKCGFMGVSTYINSGNIIFESSNADEADLVKVCESAIEKQFGFAVRVAIISADEMRDSLAHAPGWWDSSAELRHNAIIVIAPTTAEDVLNELGEIKPEYEKIAYYGKIIFWSADIKAISRTRYAKIVATRAYKNVTIRNANTTKKLLELVS